MAEKEHIPLGVGFYPDWFYGHYGIPFGRKYYFDPETRIEAKMEIDKRLYERFGDVGLGTPNPEPKPLITFGMVMLPAVFGCEIIFKDDALPWAMPLNLSDDQVMKLEVPDIFNTSPMSDMIKQIEYLKNKYGKVVGDINVTGVQNLALKLRGDQLYVDYFENPEICHHLLHICTQSIIQLFRFIYEITGTGAMDVTPMCDPSLYVLPNCTVEQISSDTYEKFVLDYDNQVADSCQPVGIHHCGSVDEVMEAYAKVRNLEFIEIGFGSDVKKTRQVFGPDVAVNARINPVLMKNGTVDDVAEEVCRLIDQGSPLHNFSIDTVGLTYGTPDENVKAARKTAAEYGKIPSARPRAKEKEIAYISGVPGKVKETAVSSASKTVFIGPSRPVTLIGERINPTGHRGLVRSLEDDNMDIVKSEAIKQVEEGAHILDVNVGLSGIDEPKILKEAVLAIQEVTDVPLCIDSALPRALERALEVYKGKALVNSVNGEKDKLEKVLPLVKAHGAAVIGLTMDEKGIPKDRQGRFNLARRIVEEADKAGIPREDVIIDPLAMAVSADHEAGLETLEAIRLIRDELGVNQTLGISNISFGLPERAPINAVFLSMAVLSGITCPIIDPTQWEIRRALLIADMMLGRDRFCRNYLNISQAKLGTREDAEGYRGQEEAFPETELDLLKQAVIDGKRKEAVALTKKALDRGEDPQGIIDNYLIPALNAVGQKFEQKKLFVPGMIMAARSMQACVELIEPLMQKESKKTLGTVILGTVFGDLHDIGKNLVKLLLETSGFQVIDLGENVPPKSFVEAAQKNNADIVGLSSLLTTGDPYVEETVMTIRKSSIGDKVKIICGGAALTEKFVKTCGADAYAENAAQGVKKSKAFLGITS